MALDPAVAGILGAVAGGSIGVVLDPLRNRFARKALLRQRLTDHCEELIRAATASRSATYRMNELHRRKEGGEPVADGVEDEAGAGFDLARRRVRESIALVQLYGPDTIAQQAARVRTAEREMRRRRFSLEPAPEGAEPYAAPVDLQVASDEFETETLSFARVARDTVR